MKRILLFTPFLVVLALQAAKPNIIFILADDMGYGDVQALNPKSKIPTPHLNRLAKEGMTFTDAHSPSGVCTPTRYGVITGRYCWRSSLKRGVLGGYSAPLIEKDRSTVGSVLQKSGYYTAAIGKWHLGMNMTRREGGRPAKDRWDGDGNVDFTKPIADSPITRGFHEYFGVSASLDMAPYVWIENDHFVKAKLLQQPAVKFPGFVRTGPRAADLKFEEGLDVLGERAAGFLKRMTKQKKPFFLYMPLTGPHKPVTPHSRFTGKTGLGPYGDFVMNVDDTVGQVLKALDETKLADNTLVLFTSDNGSFMYRVDDEDDHVKTPGKQQYHAKNHTANGPWRGTKADIWEGGHHVPFFARWPGKVKPGSNCEHVITHTDLFATAAEVAGTKVPKGAAADSYSYFPLLLGNEKKYSRPPVIHHSSGGMFAIREGDWKLILGNGSGGRQAPKGKPFQKPFFLANILEDGAETKNRAESDAKIAARLEAAFHKIHTNERR
ncbi:MAG: arylsulfatase [Verrucomicrobiota bacterium]|nr:arylsulfatase [Verrucomicrobiota bacterium]